MDMASIRIEDLTEFGRLAVKLDRELAELTREGGLITGVNLDSDGGLDEGIKILNRVAGHGQSVAEIMEEFAKALQDARDKAEAATKLVAERAQVIQARRQRQEELLERLTKVKEEITAAGANLVSMYKPENADKARIAAELQRLQEPMAAFITSAQAIKAEAAAGNFKRLERQADSVIDSLQASLRKLTQAISPK